MTTTSRKTAIPLAPRITVGLVAALVLVACAESRSATLASRSQSFDQTSSSTLSGGAPAPSQGKTDATAGIKRIGAFDRGRAMDHVRALAADIGVRVRATRNERRGIGYVAGEFRKLGYRVNIQEFAVDGGTSRNVVAWWPHPRSQQLVVGGHIDTVRGAPGANDNASGVAVMLENARLFAGTSQVRWLKFVAFGSEEYGSNGVHHVGSHVFVNRLGREGRRRTAGMISIDMVADGRPLIIGTAGIGPPRVARTLYRKLDRAGIAVDYQITCDCSDNGPFERAGIPGSFMWSGYEPNYHDDSDTVRNLRPEHLRRSGRATRIFLRKVDAGMISYFQDS